MSYSISRIAAVTMATGLLVGLVACSQDNDNDKTDTSASAATTSPSQASDHVTGQSTRGDAPAMIDEKTLRDRIVGHTVAGSMSSGDAYGEYYAPDGRILAKTYTGNWQIKDGRFCLDYGQGTTCYGVALDGFQVTWYANAKKVGEGRVQQGNPNGFTGKNKGS